MGSKFSKGHVRRELQPLVPSTWVELLKLFNKHELEFKALSDRYFMHFPSFQVIYHDYNFSKTQLLSMFDVLDPQRKKKVPFLEFFGGLALLVDAKRSTKIEFLLSILDNGSTRSLNYYEVLMILTASIQGIARFKYLPGIEENNPVFVARRLMGDLTEATREMIVDRALIDPDIMFFMGDLEAESVLSADKLLAQQSSSLCELADLDFRIMEKKFGSIDLSRTESVRQFQSLVDTTDQVLDFTLVKAQSSLFGEYNDQCSKDFDTKSLNFAKFDKIHMIRSSIPLFVSNASGNCMKLCTEEINYLFTNLCLDQLGGAKASDFFRLFKRIVWKRQHEAHIVWEYVTNCILKVAVYFRKKLDFALHLADIEGCKNNIQSKSPHRSETLEHELHNENEAEFHLRAIVDIRRNRSEKGAKLHIEYESKKTQENVICSPPSNVIDWSDVLCDGELARFLIISLTLNADVTDDAAMELSSSIENYLRDDLVISRFSSMWRSCKVDVKRSFRIHEDTSEIEVHTLELNFLLCTDLFERLDKLALNNLVQKFCLDLQLNDSIKSMLDIAISLDEKIRGTSVKDYWRALVEKVSSDIRRASEDFDIEDINVWLQSWEDPTIDLNDLEAALENVRESLIVQGINDASDMNLDFLTDEYRGIGSINHLLCGSLAVDVTINNSVLRSVESYLCPIRSAQKIIKRIMYISNFVNDWSVELSFSSVAKCLDYLRLSVPKFITNQSAFANFALFIRNFFGPQHEYHDNENECINLVCAINSSLSKSIKQTEMVNQRRNMPHIKSTLEASCLKKFVKAYCSLRQTAKQIDHISLRCPNSSIDCTLENLNVF